MASNRQVVVDRSALLTILLHAAKHPTSAVNGLLLGELRAAAAPAPGASPPTSPRSAAPTVHVLDAIPVVHSFVTLTPVLECALAQVEAHVQQQQQPEGQPKLRIVGYYHANERLADTDLGPAGRRAADRVESLAPGSVALVVESRALAEDGAAPLLQLFTKDGRGWARTPSAAPGSGGNSGGGLVCPSAGIIELLGELMAEGRHRRLADFEEHLQQPALDWLNPGLLE